MYYSHKLYTFKQTKTMREMLGVEMRPCFEMPGRDDEMIPDDGQP